MNIALVYDYEITGYDPNGLQNEETLNTCGTSLRDSLRALDVKVRTFSLGNSKTRNGLLDVKNAINSGYRPDVIYLKGVGELPPGVMEMWDKTHFKNILLVGEGGDEWQIFRYNFPWTSKSDLVFTSDAQCVIDYNKHNVLSFWSPHWVDERVFAYGGENKTRGCSTTSKPSAWKNKRGFNIFNEKLQEVFGDQFINPCYDRNGAYITIEENGELYKESKIVWQFSSSGDWTRRIWEGAAAKALVITDKLHPIRRAHELAIEDEEIIYYSNLEECIEKMKYYLENDTEREEIANRLYQRTMRDHTGLARARQIKEIISYAI